MTDGSISKLRSLIAHRAVGKLKEGATVRISEGFWQLDESADLSRGQINTLTCMLGLYIE